MDWLTALREFLERLDNNGLIGLLHALNQSPPKSATRGNFREAVINSLLTTAQHNKAFRNRILQAANIRDIEEEELQLQQQMTAATVDAAKSAQISADEARRANELAAEANRIAAEANERAKAANAKSGKATFVAWLSLITAIIGLTTAVIKSIRG